MARRPTTSISAIPSSLFSMKALKLQELSHLSRVTPREIIRHFLVVIVIAAAKDFTQTVSFHLFL